MFANVTALLEAEGASWKHVVKTTLFLKDMAYYNELSAIRTAFFKEQGVSVYPASTCVQATLCRPELLCEMEAMAIIGDKS
jgi:2-iminobutanoate/2-iminopropanoate deaminase